MNDDVLRGSLRYCRHGKLRTERMAAETASWILGNNCGVVVDDESPDFVSDRRTELWWHQDDRRFSHHKEEDK